MLEWTADIVLQLHFGSIFHSMLFVGLQSLLHREVEMLFEEEKLSVVLVFQQQLLCLLCYLLSQNR